MEPIRFPGESAESRRARVLRERVDRLRDARQRIITAADAERQRIERDLHDGAQQRLVALTVMLGLAESRLASDPASAARLIAEAREEAQLAVKELRELAHGIHPTLLSERGLGAALEALATRAPLPVEVRGVPAFRLPSAVESTAYFVTAEALTNVAKYARAGQAFVHLSFQDARLHLQVGDDGVGGADASGTGLRGLRDRVDALDGRSRCTRHPVAVRRSGSSCPCRGDHVRDTVTERTGGRCVAAPNQLAPASAEPKTSPDVAPK
jgi:signal transduction histidine kinase